MSNKPAQTSVLLIKAWAGVLAAALIAAFGTADLKAAENLDPAATAESNPWQICADFTARAEAETGLPAHLLAAISKVESGRWDASQGAVSAWPWTVTSGDEGGFFPTKAAAIAEVRALRAQGRRNIDVGCMQINLKHHPEAFADLEAAFDPAQNVAYAASLLLRLRQEARSWTKAIAFYHSRTPKFNGPYRLKVFRAWREERHDANRAAMASTTQQATLSP
jgi:hypothetical protein